MDKVAALTSDERRHLFEETAAKRGMFPAVVEKDFWVCWVLKSIFSDPTLKTHLVFKGGTSLSKVFGLIERFSEDVDLILDWRLLGYGSNQQDPYQNQPSNTKQDRFNAEFNRKTARYLTETLCPKFAELFSRCPKIHVAVDPEESQIVNIRYPAAFSSDYLRPEVRLEIGPLASYVPRNSYIIQPYAAKVFPGVFVEPDCPVVAINAERTFWEKATILHQQAHRTDAIPDRYSRHYYDMYQLAKSEVKKLALDDLSLLKDVAEFKNRFYRCPWARYEDAKPGSFKLIPKEEHLASLQIDYRQMEVMIFGTIPEFNQIIETLSQLENEINQLSPNSSDKDTLTMDKLDARTDGATANIVEQNIDKLRELFPDAFTEGSDEHGPQWKVDIDALGEILGQYVEDQPERYSFAWNGKSRARRIAQTPSTGTLRPCPEESVNWDTTQNLFIEGDNLEVLKLLQKSYHKKVKMIYIDPPYNTGKEFIYPDKFQDNLDTYLRYTGQTDEEGFNLSANAETSGRYHTNWMNMMLPRLKLARNLLRDDGVIFISIDDNEVHNLRLIMNEVFGEENLLAELVWHLPAGTSAGHFTRAHEYVVVYAKKKEGLPNFPATDDTPIIGRTTIRPSSMNPTTEIEFPAGVEFEDEDAEFSGTLGNEEPVEIVGNKMIFQKGRLVRPVKLRAAWRMRNQMISWLKGQETLDSKGQRLKRIYFNRGGVPWYEKERGFVNPKTLVQAGTTKDGTLEIENLFGKRIMPFPKPTQLLKYLVGIPILPNEGAVVLDFFAGSCTTAHAVLKINKEDGGNRRFIMVQLPEKCDEQSEAFKAGYKTIADIGRERIRRVIKQIESEQKQKAKEAKERLPGTAEDVPDLDLGFKVFKLEASNIKPWDADFDNLEAALFNAVENIKPDRSEADVLYELLLKYGLDLAVPMEDRKIDGKTVYIIGAGALVVCLADKISLDVVEGIAALKDELKPEVMRVVFKDAGFADDVVKTNAVQILRQADIEDVKSL